MGAGAALYLENGDLVAEYSEAVQLSGGSTLAELWAALMGLKKAREHGATHAELVSDCQVVVEYATITMDRAHHQLRLEIMAEVRRFHKVVVRKGHRYEVDHAHRLARAGAQVQEQPKPPVSLAAKPAGRLWWTSCWNCKQPFGQAHVTAWNYTQICPTCKAQEAHRRAQWQPLADLAARCGVEVHKKES